MRIFSATELRDKRLPRPEDFQKALDHFEALCILPFIKDGVVGAFPYGSTVNGGKSVASDLDYFILADDDSYNYPTLVGRCATQVMDSHHVRVEPRIIMLSRAWTGLHGIDAAFRYHLERVASSSKGLQGDNPFNHFPPQEDTIDQAVKAALISYERKLLICDASARSSEADLLENAKQFFNRPIDTARYVVLQTYARLGALEEMPLKNESMLATYRTLIPPTTADSLERLLSTRREYLTLVEHVRDATNETEKETAIKGYQRFLELVSDFCLPAATAFIDENLEIIR